jgi:predicted dehydrogenase
MFERADVLAESPPLRLGVIGAGGFARFAVSHLVGSDGVVPVAVADVDQERAISLGTELSVDVIGVQDLIEGDGADILYIATPPSSHASLAIDALARGKHVLCEKPLAVTVPEADRVVDAAHRAGRFAVANLMQRYNPLARSIRVLIDHQLLGAPLRVTLENYASDENLPLDHWFWNPNLSGGIFVEHGVHFFDLFASWFGEGDVLSSVSVLRPGSNVEEQVRCTVRYPGGVIGDMYHGFHQPTLLDRTQIRVLFERGDVLLSGWVPTEVRIEALVDDETEASLYALFTDTHVERLDVVDGGTTPTSARHRSFLASRHVVLAGGDQHAKMARYGDLVRRLFADQLSWVRDPSHERLIDERASRNAVEIACQASDHSIVVHAAELSHS